MILQLPLEPYQVGGYAFGERLRRRFGVPAVHLGEDVVAEPGTRVNAIGAGRVVLAKMLLGSEEKRNWGGVVIIQHQTFYSIYGHLKVLQVKSGEAVTGGQSLGEVAGSSTPENGWWKIAHLHFAIYTGPWQGQVLPGWWRPERFWRTRLSWWHAPRAFIEEYTQTL